MHGCHISSFGQILFHARKSAHRNLETTLPELGTTSAHGQHNLEGWKRAECMGAWARCICSRRCPVPVASGPKEVAAEVPGGCNCWALPPPGGNKLTLPYLYLSIHMYQIYPCFHIYYIPPLMYPHRCDVCRPCHLCGWVFRGGRALGSPQGLILKKWCEPRCAWAGRHAGDRPCGPRPWSAEPPVNLNG